MGSCVLALVVGGWLRPFLESGGSSAIQPLPSSLKSPGSDASEIFVRGFSPVSYQPLSGKLA